MPLAAIGGAVSGVSSLIGGILGHNAADDAAKLQAQAGQTAAKGQAQAGQTAQNYSDLQLAREKQSSQPYMDLGASTGGTLLNALSPGGSLSGGWNQTFSAPTAAEAEATPGYDFTRTQGINALQNSAAARGGLLSTGTAKNLADYTTGLANTTYGDTFNRALSTYNTNYSTFRNNQNDLYNRLFGTTQLGAGAAGAYNSTSAGTTNALNSNLIGNAEMVGNDIMGVGNAQAAGRIGSTNALLGGIGGAANAAGQTLQSLLGAKNASGGYTTNSYPTLPNELRDQGVY